MSTDPIPPREPGADGPASPARRDDTPVVHVGTSETIWWWIGLGLFGCFYLSMYFNEYTRRIALNGLQSLPFLLLAVLAYVGQKRPDAKVLTIGYWFLLVGVVGLLVNTLGIGAVLDAKEFEAIQKTQLNSLGESPSLDDFFRPSGGRAVGRMVLLSFPAAFLGFLGFVPAVRRLAASFLPLDPDSFVHATALATVLAVTALCLVPLVVLGHPPILMLIQNTAGTEIANELEKESSLLDMLYAFIWQIPVAAVVVGYPLARSFSAALRRLGLVIPTWWQVVLGLLVALTLVGFMTGFENQIKQIWTRLDWPQTDQKAFEQLIKFAINPLGAVVIGVTAGIGEELAVRGVLQPRLGILLSNVFFTALHALQYNFDGLLTVFVIGLILGVIRKYSNTTTSAVVHGTFDFVVVLIMASENPG